MPDLRDRLAIPELFDQEIRFSSLSMAEVRPFVKGADRPYAVTREQ